MMMIGLGVTVNYPSHVVDPARLKEGPEDTLCYIRRYNLLVLVIPVNYISFVLGSVRCV